MREPTGGVYRGQLPRIELGGEGWSVGLEEQIENTQHGMYAKKKNPIATQYYSRIPNL